MASVPRDDGEDGGQGDGGDSDTLSVSDICQLDGPVTSDWITTSDGSDENIDQNDAENEQRDEEGNVADIVHETDESEDQEDETETNTNDTDSENEVESSGNEGDDADQN